MTSIIMYHYIRKYDKKIPHLNFLNKQDFLKQIKYFKKKFIFFKANENLHKMHSKKKNFIDF